MKRVCILLMVMVSGLFSQTLRPSHWISDYVRYYQHRGQLWDFSPIDQPYDLQSLNKSMRSLQSSYPYLKQVTGLTGLLPDTTRSVYTWLQSNNNMDSSSELEYYQGTQRLSVGMRVNPWLDAYTGFLVDNRLDERMDYLGKRQAGLAAFTEQACLLARYKSFEFKIGRDFIRWGPGRDATLMISDHSRPMDQVSVAFRTKRFRFSFFTASLDPTFYRWKGRASRQNRYVSGHKLEIRPFKYVYISISEAILFGGPGFSYKFSYINPLLFYHGEQLNDSDAEGAGTGNTIGSINIAFMPVENIYLYGDLMIDDIQLEQSGPGDLEPSELGFMLGLNVADPVRLNGIDVFAEYSRITNRTFNSLQPWEKWLHRQQPMGHSLGNDFDRILAGMQYWPVTSLLAKVQFENIRKGEGQIRAPFDTPWADTPLGQTYNESFPFGTVENRQILTLSVQWLPRWWFYTQVEAKYWNIENKMHIPNRKDDFWQFLVTVKMDLIRTLRFM